MSGSSERQVYGDPRLLADTMQSLVNSQDYSDVKLILGPGRQVVYAHRALLATRCPVLRRLLQDGGESPLVMYDVDPKVFLPVLGYLYTNSISLEPRTAVDFLAAGLEYGLDSLKQVCLDYLCDHLTVSSACESLEAGVVFRLNQLKDAALSFIEENTAEVFASNGFQVLSRSSDKLMEFIRQLYLRKSSNHFSVTGVYRDFFPL